MSNPLRQSLYTLDDCLNGGQFKALAAIQSLERIFPSVEAEGVVMAISMPGHPVTRQEEESVVNDCTRLQCLVDSHDAVFLLTDTRESRWLPTLFCANADKSTANRTLDLHCYTSRSVELFINILHHPCGIYTEGEISNAVNGGTDEQPLGILPHQIRGSLYHFSQMMLVGHSSTSCTACCSIVVSEYRKRGMEFLLRAINHPTHLKDLTGLTELKNAANSLRAWSMRSKEA